MRMGFLIPRNTFLKTMGGLIGAGLGHGHEVVVLYQRHANEGDKAYQNVRVEAFPHFVEGEVRFAEYKLSDLRDVGRKHDLDVLITHEGFAYFQALNRLDDLIHLRNTGTRVVSLCHFYEIAMRPLEALTYVDKTFYISRFGRDLHFELQADGDEQQEAQERLSDQFEIASSPMFDQILVAMKSPQPPLAQLGSKKVVLLIAPVITPDTVWRYHVWREPSRIKRTTHLLRQREHLRELTWRYLREVWRTESFATTVAAIRSYCDRNDALLVVKSRAKQLDPDYLVKSADIYLSGDQETYYPVFTTYRWLTIAHLCVTVQSMTTLEAVVAGVPVVSIHVPYADYGLAMERKIPGYSRYLSAILRTDRVGPMSFPGCVVAVSHRDAAAWFRRHTLEDADFRASSQAQYTETYLGVTSRSSSERILETLESMVGLGAKSRG